MNHKRKLVSLGGNKSRLDNPVFRKATAKRESRELVWGRDGVALSETLNNFNNEGQHRLQIRVAPRLLARPLQLHIFRHLLQKNKNQMGSKRFRFEAQRAERANVLGDFFIKLPEPFGVVREFVTLELREINQMLLNNAILAPVLKPEQIEG